MERLKLILNILKFGAIAVGSISGLIGTLTETRNRENGKTTSWGNRIVALIILSGVIAVTIQSIETYLKHRSDTQEARVRQETDERTSKILEKANQTAAGIQATQIQQDALLQNLQQNVEKTDTLRRETEKFGNELKSQHDAIDKTVAGFELTARGLNSIIAEQYRVMQPIESVSAFIYQLGVSMDDPSLVPYRVRLNKGLDRVLAKSPWSDEVGLRASLVSSVNGVSVPLEIEVGTSNPLFAQYGVETLPREILSIQYMQLAFYKTPKSPNEFLPFSEQTKKPDLSIMFIGKEALYLRKDLRDGTFSLTGWFESPQKSQWQNNSGAIIAIPDLVNSQLFISFGPMAVGGKNNEHFLNVRAKFLLNSFNLNFGNRSCWIRSSQLHKYVSQNGVVFWEFLFPATQAEIFASR